MVKLHFKNTDEFTDLFKTKKVVVTRTIVEGIEKAVMEKKRTAELFQISFEEVDHTFEISLPKSQWKVSLESCLDHYHELELADEQIDTWKLLEAIKILS